MRPQKPRGEYSDDTPLIEGKTVIEADPVKTGLLDKNGNPLVRMTHPIGFKLGSR